ncbi:hypothetical protein SCOR_31830 [Sulfidibacter corallicola]|uniref:6-bladed beta-propeller n=1 Tax=Sulfidibacter corallicola TaxID=2818388 RepID=A0A8A4TJY6_SULCO|nr:6-bladed beta-propeller [Sulfidibacter corallicola]QTD49860.1 hypothetical protein J3U87_30120 [Sulfidibacter corallicola]
MLFLWMMLFTGPSKITFTPIKTLAPLPEDQDIYLQNVIHVEVDETGRYYVSDFPSARIYMWNPDGSYAGFFGGKGEGPGEFVFAAALGPPMGHVYQTGERTYVYDGANRAVSVFDAERRFVARVTLQGLGGKINAFHVLERDRFLFYDSYFCEEKACRRILEYDGKGNLTKTWSTSPDNTWQHVKATGKVKLFIWEPIPVVDFSRKRGEVVLAHSQAPMLTVYDRKGREKRKVTLDIPRKQVTREDIAEYNAQPWLKDANHVVPVFPDQKDYFDRILTLDQGYLLYHLSPFYGRANGYLVDFDGKLMGRFELACGEGGGLFAPYGRLMAALIDEEGDISVHEMKVH